MQKSIEEIQTFDRFFEKNQSAFLNKMALLKLYGKMGLYPKLKGKSMLLDIGCGEGNHTLALAKLGYQATGIDLSRVGIKKARAKAEKEKIKANFLAKDYLKVKFPPSSFEIIVFFDALHHFYYGGLELVIKKTSRILKPGGILVMLEPNHFYPYNHLAYTLANYFQTKLPLKINYLEKMFTSNERSLNPEFLISKLSKDYQIKRLIYLSYTMILGSNACKSPFYWPRKVLHLLMNLFPKKYQHDHFIILLVKK